MRGQSQPRPLVVRFGSMGDMVIALTLIRALHQRFGAPVDVVSSGSWTRPLLESQPGVGRLYLIRSRKTPYWLSPLQWGLVRALRARGTSPTWICDASDKSRWLIARAGFSHADVVDVHSVPDVPHEHAADRWLRFAQISPPALTGARAVAMSSPDLRIPHLQIREEWRDESRRWLDGQGLTGRDLVLVQAGNRRTTKWARPRKRASNTKYWPEERWAYVVDAIACLEPSAEILLTGVAPESRFNDAVLRLVTTASARNIAADLPLHRLLALQEQAIGMISVDTGPAHSAAALGCPLVVLFGLADPHLYGPRSPHDSVVCLQSQRRGSRCMLGISGDDVVNAWKSLEHARSCRRARNDGHAKLASTASLAVCPAAADGAGA